MPAKKTYRYHALAEACPSVEPVVVLELIDLDALSLTRWWRTAVRCHYRRRRVDTLRLGQTPSGARRAIAIVCAGSCEGSGVRKATPAMDDRAAGCRAGR
jgi:hypothetical protein